MATNLVYRNTDSQNRVEDLGETFAPGAPALSEALKPVVAVTGSGDYTISTTDYAPYTISGIPAGGVGLEGTETTFAFDGTWEFDEGDVEGTTAATMTQGLAIYATGTAAGAAVLTTTSAGNTLYGYVDIPVDYDKTRGMVPVRIGA